MKNKEKQGRGVITSRIQEKAKELLGYEIDTDFLRLIPFIQYCVINQERYLEKCSIQEIGVINALMNTGYLLEYGEEYSKKLKCSKEFWDIMCELVWLGYVDIDVQL